MCFSITCIATTFQQFVDVVGVHAPGYAPPEIGPDDQAAKARWFTFRRVEDLRKIMLRYNDGARQMAIMEFGYTTDTRNPDYAWFGVSEEQQADYLERAYEYAIANWRPWIGLMTLIYMPDLTWLPGDEEFLVVYPRSCKRRPARGLYQAGEHAQSLWRTHYCAAPGRWTSGSWRTNRPSLSVTIGYRPHPENAECDVAREIT